MRWCVQALPLMRQWRKRTTTGFDVCAALGILRDNDNNGCYDRQGTGNDQRKLAVIHCIFWVWHGGSSNVCGFATWVQQAFPRCMYVCQPPNLLVYSAVTLRVLYVMELPHCDVR